MGDTTAISWADHTFNPWEGCTRLSPACDNCYAADRAHRFGNDHLWAGELRRTSPANWRKPLAWNRAAEAAGARPRVFCASLADVFDNQAPQEWREDLWRLIEATPNLTWMLLTKRPQNVVKMLPADKRWFMPGRRPTNIWLGVTAEDQRHANQRVGYLLMLANGLRWLTFVSAEPLLEPVDLSDVTIPGNQNGVANALTGTVATAAIYVGGEKLAIMGPLEYPPIGLVIAGGESGPKARPSHPDWFRALRDQCAAAGVPFHFKQWGEWLPDGQDGATRWPRSTGNRERVSEQTRVGSAAAGRLLDGVEHVAMPEVQR